MARGQYAAGFRESWVLHCKRERRQRGPERNGRKVVALGKRCSYAILRQRPLLSLTHLHPLTRYHPSGCRYERGPAWLSPTLSLCPLRHGGTNRARGHKTRVPYITMSVVIFGNPANLWVVLSW